MSGAGGFGVGPVPEGGGLKPLMPTSTIELTIKCTNLCDKDVLSKSDPVCVFTQKKKGQWHEIGRTERIKDSHNPEWLTKFVIDYSFEERQDVKFEIYDWDSTNNKLSMHDFLGRCETTLGAIVSSKNHQFVSVLRDTPKTNSGSKIFISCEELSSSKETAEIQFRAEKLDKKDLFGKSDPFFVVSKFMPTNGQYSIVYRSEYIKNNLNPTWKPFKIKVRDLCNCDYDRGLKIDVYDWDSNGKHDLIGSVKTNLKALSIAVVEKKQFPCINEDKKKKSSYKDSGIVYVAAFKTEVQHTFLDYIQNGTAMNFSVAVDFTASNGDPRDARSLHYRDPATGENQYTTAIRSVGDIIQDYDADKQFPALGFGARIPPHGKVSDEFFLNLHPDNPYCFGVQGLLQAYFTALQQVTLFGPTNFSPVINHVARFSSSYKDGRNYFVLLILTDGIITDLDLTIAAIVHASTLPMSIIIVGVGAEDFSAMEALDCDRGMLKSGNQVASRDIVQFVELRKFMGPGNTWDKESLAKQVLAEIPHQVVQWMTLHGIRPGTAGS